MKLAAFTHGRDNNFNLLRITAALLVLITHSFALALGSPEAEPFRDSLGMTVGTIAVDIFFVASGFLVFASLEKSQSAIDFLWARILRIYPALIVMLFITVFGMGLYFTTVSWPDFLSARQTYSYLARCGTLVFGVVYQLPGVFESNPYKSAVNGSLWSMRIEIRMYLLLVSAWVIASVFFKPNRLRLVAAASLSFTVVAGGALLFLHFRHTEIPAALRLSFMFFTGCSYFILRRRIELSSLAAAVILALMVAGVLVGKQAFYVVYVLTVPYVIFWLAYLPGGKIRGYNKLGDYSYGVYIYAFPVQQALAALVPGISVPAMILGSALVTLSLAAASWHLLEKRMLAHKRHFVDKTHQLKSFVGA